jgi:hypothetical protein
VGVGQHFFLDQIGRGLIGHAAVASTGRILIHEVPLSPNETVASTLEDIAPTCLYKDPTLGTGVAAEVAYTTLVDQHMVPS